MRLQNRSQPIASDNKSRKSKSHKRKSFVPEPDEVGMDMTPMIDCVFLLLIFFMCTTTFKTVSDRFDNNLPRLAGLERTERNTPIRPEPISIGILDADADALRNQPAEIRDNRSATFIVEGVRAVRRDEELLAILSSLPNDTPIRVHAVHPNDTHVPFKEIIRLMDICYSSGKSDIRFRAPRP